jgi:nicotinamide-nucleotide amidase
MNPSAVVLSTGEELMTGKVVDTNSSYIAEKLYALGFEVLAVLKVGDAKEKLKWALKEAVAMADLIVGTGGLGPTADDLTTETVAEFFGLPLITDEGVAGTLRHRFESRGLPWTKNNLKQALFPEGAAIIPNPIGTAPGFRVDFAPEKSLLWLSGVPKEMVAMLDATVLPWAQRQIEGGVETAACTFKIYGLTESKLDETLKPVALPDSARLSFRAHYPDLSLTLSVRGGATDGMFKRLREEILDLIRPYVYAEGTATMEEVVGKLLVAKGLTLAVAESCTGGYLSHRMTRLPGSSAYFKGSTVAYSNDLKVDLLRVDRSILERFGAVSRETAVAMARGLSRATGADIALSVTGIAGPSGGNPEKPVGTVWAGLARGGKDDARLFRLAGEREHVIVGASQAALNWLRTVLGDS